METCFVDNMSYDRVPRFSRPQNGKDDLKQTMEECRVKNEEMEMRAINAEMKATHFQFEMDSLQSEISRYKDKVAKLEGQLSSLRDSTTLQEENLQRFQRKLSRIRKAITIEVEKIKKSETDRVLAYDSIVRCILEFKSNVISKKEFILAVDMIHSTLMDQTSHTSSSILTQVPLLSIFGNTETRKFALLSPTSRKTRLQALMSMLEEQEIYATTEDEFLDRDEDQSGDDRTTEMKLPLVPHRTKSVPSILEDTREEKGVSRNSASYVNSGAEGYAMHSTDRQLLSAFKPGNSSEDDGYRGTGLAHRSSQASLSFEQSYERSSPSTQYALVGFDSDSESSDNFEQFVPPKRRSRYISEPYVVQKNNPSLDRRISSPLPESCKEMIKKSSPILTKRPVWYSKPEKLSVMQRQQSLLSVDAITTTRKKDMDKTATSCKKVIIKSKSFNKIRSHSVTPNHSTAQVSGQLMACDYSDDNTGGTVESKEYSKPFEHILWKKLGLEDGSALSGSLPLLDNFLSGENEDCDDPDGCTYLDPKELEDYCERFGNKRITNRVHKRFGTALSGTYLTLSKVNGDSHELGQGKHTKEPSTTILVSPSSPSPTTRPVENPSLALISNMERWRRTTDIVDSSCCSGYSTDASSAYGDFDDTTLTRSFSKRYNNGGIETSLLQASYSCDEALDQVGRRIYYDQEDEEIYEEIEDFSDTNPAELKGNSLEVATSIGTPFQLPNVVPQLQSSYSLPNESQFSDSHPPHSTLMSMKKELFPPHHSHERVYACLNDTPISESVIRFQEPPSLPPRPLKKLSSLEPREIGRRRSYEGNIKVPGIGPLPLYMTIKDGGHHVQLVPLTDSPCQSQDENGIGENEPNDHLYDLGKFMSIHSHSSHTFLDSPERPDIPRPLPPRSRQAVTLPPSTKLSLAEQGSESGSDVTSSPPLDSSIETPPSDNFPHRSHTFTSRLKKKVNLEKSGYLKKMDPKLKKWNRRWFMLKGSELKYYKPNRRALKGVINLDTWCKLTKCSCPESFELATPKKTYHLVCKSEEECDDWLEAIEGAMQLHTMYKTRAPLNPTSASISGWAQVSHNGQTNRYWCALRGNNNIDLCSAPEAEPIRSISVAQSSLRKKRDSILLDISRSNRRSLLFTVKDSSGLTELCPEKQEDKDSWYYHLSAIQSGEQDVQLTKTEKLISEMRSSPTLEHLQHPNWKHPVLNCTIGSLLASLTSLPSASLSDRATRLFQSLQLFLTTKLTLRDLNYHIHSAQHIIGTCLKHSPLRDELYCQVLRQISGHTSTVSIQVTQGWLLLFLMITSFLPIRPNFMWYLKTYLDRHSSSPHATISGFARSCLEVMALGQEHGHRQCKPSNIELVYTMSQFESGSKLDHTLIVPVFLSDGSNLDVQFNPFSSINDLVSTINKLIDMPDASQTCFAIMCDWPGMDDGACCCPIPESKVVDVIATWSAALEELYQATAVDSETINSLKNQRNILFTYKKRLFIHDHIGLETDNETILLAYQISKSIHSGEYPLQSPDKAVSLAAMMTQIEHGDWNSQLVEQDGETLDQIMHEAILLFCPWSLTHLALDHDLILLKKKLGEHWENLCGLSKEQCARKLVGIAQQWSQYGSTFFPAEEYVSANPRRLIWLSVDEKGVSIRERVSLKIFKSYSYNEISTFGGNGEDYFMLVISSPSSASAGQSLNAGSRSQLPSQQGNTVEKLMFAMPKLKICEATFLMASYIELNSHKKRNK